jgi:hypothetical protein
MHFVSVAAELFRDDHRQTGAHTLTDLGAAAPYSYFSRERPFADAKSGQADKKRASDCRSQQWKTSEMRGV